MFYFTCNHGLTAGFYKLGALPIFLLPTNSEKSTELISTTMAKWFWCEVFAGWMPFLSPNQQRIAMKGN